MNDVEHVRRLFELLRPTMDERTERLLAAAVAESLGRGGAAVVTEATGIRGKRIWLGKQELREADGQKPRRQRRVRRKGAGRKPLIETDATLLRDLEGLVEPTSRGDPESPLRWTTKSLRRLSEELRHMGHQVSPTKVGELLHGLGYSLQANRKRIEGKQHPDRDAQFRYINRRTSEMQKAGNPVISVDTKKKELIGPFANKGQEWAPSGEPIDVRVHDFPDELLGKAVPYGIYDVSRNEGLVNVGMSHDTGAFAVNSIRTWWWSMGREAYPEAREVLIVADGGGSNSSRNRLWKTQLQGLADETGLRIHVSHMPPGTSKWNKIEHRMFSFISMNWRGKPLENYQTIVKLIGATTNDKGLKVRATLDTGAYEKGIKVPEEQMSTLELRKKRFHGDWNYAISPARV